MAKKKKHKFPRPRNAAPSGRGSSSKLQPPISTGRRILFTTAGAAGTSLASALLTRQGWAPKTFATAIGLLGLGLASQGKSEEVQSIGAGAMSAAAGELGLMFIAENEQDKQKEKDDKKKTDSKKPANAGALPPGALEAALEKARTRMLLDADDLSPRFA